MMWPMNHHCAPPGWIYYPVAVPVYYPPPAPECCEAECTCDCDCKCEELTVPQQIDATGDANPTALVGGHDDANLTLEYLVEDGAADPIVTVTAVQPGGTTSTWTDSGVSVGFHVQEKFLAVRPGTKLTLEVNDIKITARLRWCETICC